MKKLLIISGILLLFITQQVYSKYITLDELRAMYSEAASNETACKKLLDYCEEKKENRLQLYAGYKAMGLMIMAKHVYSPLSKYSNFNKGRLLLEEAIKKDSKNTELRYLRFSVQTNAPKFLNYKQHIGEDKEFLVYSLSGMQDLQLKRMIIQALKKSNLLTAEEKTRIL